MTTNHSLKRKFIVKTGRYKYTFIFRYSTNRIRDMRSRRRWFLRKRHAFIFLIFIAIFFVFVKENSLSVWNAYYKVCLFVNNNIFTYTMSTLSRQITWILNAIFSNSTMSFSKKKVNRKCSVFHYFEKSRKYFLYSYPKLPVAMNKCIFRQLKEYCRRQTIRS